MTRVMPWIVGACSLLTMGGWWDGQRMAHAIQEAGRRAGVADVEPRLHALSQRLAHEDEARVLHSELIKLVRELKLQSQGITFTPLVPPAGTPGQLRGVTFAIPVEGSYDAIRTFLNHLESRDVPLAIDSLRLTKARPDSATLAVEFKASAYAWGTP